MRAILIVAVIAVALIVAASMVRRQVSLPRVGPDVEQTCLDVMQKSAPDLSWVAPDRQERIRDRQIKVVTLGELRVRNTGDVVRVAGFLHAEFEWVALYVSRDSLASEVARPSLHSAAPWVSLGSLWSAEPYWRTKGPSISDRCVVVEGTYEPGAGGHFGSFNGTIDALRLDVWSTPHRPVVTTPRGPEPLPPPSEARRPR